MSIYTDTKTPEQKLADEKSRIIKVARQGLDGLASKLQTTFNNIWNNPNFTPQEILDTFGSDAVSLFQSSARVQALLIEENPNFEAMPPRYEFTINKDGTVTVGDKILTEEEIAQQELESAEPVVVDELEEAIGEIE